MSQTLRDALEPVYGRRPYWNENLEADLVKFFKHLKLVRTPVAIFGSLGVCIYVPASRQWLISYSPIHLT